MHACSAVSNSLWPHGWQSARLLCPWDSSGKNTRVGSHSLLQGIFLTQGWNWTHVSCIGRWIPPHCTTWEALTKVIGSIKDYPPPRPPPSNWCYSHHTSQNCGWRTYQTAHKLLNKLRFMPERWDSPVHLVRANGLVWVANTTPWHYFSQMPHFPFLVLFGRHFPNQEPPAPK